MKMNPVPAETGLIQMKPVPLSFFRSFAAARHFRKNAFSSGLFFTLALFLAAWGNLHAQTWAPVGSTCFSLGSSHQQSIVACNGKPYVVFDKKGSSPAGLSVMTYNGSN